MASHQNSNKKAEHAIDPNWGFNTLVNHADAHGECKNSHVTPIFQTSTFIFDSPEQGADAFAGKSSAHIYTRIGNPGVEAFEKVVAKLEKAAGCLSYPSGMAAISGLFLGLLSSGDHMIVADTMYGPTITVTTNHLPRYGITHTVANTADLKEVEKAIKPNTKLIMIETPANPTNKISDIKAIADIAHKHGALLAVDATFTSPYFQRPLELGADFSLHSLTKYMNGHGDVVGGVTSVNDLAIYKKLRLWRKDCSNGLSPFDSWLCLRGLRTLGPRMEQLQKNGFAVAEYLQTHPRVKKVMHPGFPDFPGHEIAKKQQSGFGSTFSFEVQNFEQARQLMKNVHLCTLAVSLGCVDTLIEHPASMTHAGVSKDLMAQQNLTPELIRISIGLEEPEDIIADLKQGLDALTDASSSPKVSPSPKKAKIASPAKSPSKRGEKRKLSSH